MLKISISKNAIKFLQSLQDKDYLKIRDKIKNLATDPRPSGCTKLKGVNSYRIKYRKIRILYTINDESNNVIIYNISYRKEAYKK